MRWKNKGFVRSGMITLFGGVLFVLFSLFVFGKEAAAHGYIQSPASRSLLCQQGQNVNCGQIRYEPQSLEGIGGFPQTGPADGQITGAGHYPELYEQTATRWLKVNLSGGANTFTWKLTAAHRTKEWKYYITKKGWDPNKPIARGDLDAMPFCSFNTGGAAPSSTVSHQCTVPTDRTGYYVILGVWEIFDTSNAFYQAIDVNLSNGGTGEPQVPTAPTNVTSTSQTETSIGLGWTASTAANGVKNYAIYRNQQLVATATGTSYTDTGLLANTTYTYAIQAVDYAGNKSALSTALTVKTKDTATTTFPAWDPAKAYQAGEIVTYNGVNYQAKWWSKGFKPDTKVNYEWETPWKVYVATLPFLSLSHLTKDIEESQEELCGQHY
ncbi:lytic polysaccharide monooxygenase [Ectobacillus sp. JY-23]|uniref:lytic polysaccharide monooxygenase n=1 Tax=Ectobacillus sp. JY-23 TaxID=2933872 RepID=UPI001FF65B37|nr:lytic polysaccharide monooxygenase [Ectobacillus sp. JY-23]UOY93304.1 lytic polysaccharide monooxygenase [Ectobacillus sp. JY-23]